MNAETRFALRVAISEHHRERLGLNSYTGNNRPVETRHLERDPCQGTTGAGSPCSYNAPRGEKYCFRHRPVPRCEALTSRNRPCCFPAEENDTYCKYHQDGRRVE